MTCLRVKMEIFHKMKNWKKTQSMRRWLTCIIYMIGKVMGLAMLKMDLSIEEQKGKDVHIYVCIFITTFIS